MRSGIILASAFAAALTSAASRAEAPKTLDDALRPLGVRYAGTPALKLSKSLVRQGEKVAFHTVVADGPGARIEIQASGPLPADKAARFSKVEYSVIERIYRNQTTPYAGQISRAVSCPEALSPKELSVSFLGAPTPLVAAGATDRYAFGACDDKVFRHQGGFLAYYEKGTSMLLEIRVFAARRPDEKAVSGARLSEILKGFVAADSR